VRRNASGAARLFADDVFSTPDRKACFIAPDRPALREDTSIEYPLRLNSGRLRDQWHTMTRSGQSPKLACHRPEPFLEVHPLDAKANGLTNNGFVRVRSQHGACILRVVTLTSQQRGSVFAPIHWSDASASSARVGDLVSPQTDPFSGQAEAKATPVSVAPVSFAYRGLAVTRAPLALPEGTWWARVALPGAAGVLFASNDAPMVWRDRASELFPQAVLTEYIDRARGLYRAAAFVEGGLEGGLFVGPAEAPPQWGNLRKIIGGPGIAESGPVACACFGVSLAAIHEALASRKVTSVEEISRLLRAGNKCGTCLPELGSIVNHHVHAHVV
jgi:assimilatory nitrate reductase catalytic subunit